MPPTFDAEVELRRHGAALRSLAQQAWHGVWHLEVGPFRPSW